MAERPSLQRAGSVDFDLHGYVGIRLLDAREHDRSRVVAQLGALEAPLERDPDITVRFVDRLDHGPLTFVAWQESAFDERHFYLLSGRDRVQAKTRIPFQDIGARCDIVCERGLPAVPLLLAIVNITALAKGLLPLHASAFDYQGRGVLATGWAKGGKTETLLAFMSRGARYVGDEWVYLSLDERMYGIPEPIRLWRWQVQQMPLLAARLRRSERARLGVLDALASGVERIAPRDRRGGSVGSVLRRSAPVLRRQVNVQVPPARLFGQQAIALQSRLEQVVFISSHGEPGLRIEPIDGAEVARRVAASLAHERHELLTYYGQFRFAFPERRSAALEAAAETETALSDRILANIPASWLRHPYPCPIDSLFEPVAGLLADR